MVWSKWTVRYFLYVGRSAWDGQVTAVTIRSGKEVCGSMVSLIACGFPTGVSRISIELAPAVRE
jgi:hypothetical protein